MLANSHWYCCITYNMLPPLRITVTTKIYLKIFLGFGEFLIGLNGLTFTCHGQSNSILGLRGTLPLPPENLPPSEKKWCGSDWENPTFRQKNGWENKLLLISINCKPLKPATVHSCLKKWYFPRFSRWLGKQCVPGFLLISVDCLDTSMDFRIAELKMPIDPFL